MRVETLAGVKEIDLALGDGGKVVAATVDMGEPELDEATPGSNGSAEVQPADQTTEAG